MTVPSPRHDGDVVQAPVYIRVRPGWLEKWLFVSVLVNILLVMFFLVFGSVPARQAEDTSRGNRELLCMRVYDVTPDLYEEYKDYCPARPGR